MLYSYTQIQKPLSAGSLQLLLNNHNLNELDVFTNTIASPQTVNIVNAPLNKIIYIDHKL